MVRSRDCDKGIWLIAANLVFLSEQRLIVLTTGLHTKYNRNDVNEKAQTKPIPAIIANEDMVNCEQLVNQQQETEQKNERNN